MVWIDRRLPARFLDPTMFGNDGLPWCYMKGTKVRTGEADMHIPVIHPMQSWCHRMLEQETSAWRFTCMAIHMHGLYGTGDICMAIRHNLWANVDQVLFLHLIYDAIGW